MKQKNLREKKNLADLKLKQKEAGKKAWETRRANMKLFGEVTSKVVVDDVPFKISDHMIERRENAEIKMLRKKIENIVKEYEKLSDAYDVALNLKTLNVLTEDFTIVENKKYQDEATAIIQISDCHFGKLILPSTINGLNEYNPDIAKKRMKNLANNSLKLIKKERNDIKIDNLVLILGGDFIENSQLHEHSEMSTSMSPLEEVLFAREQLSNFIKFISENGDFKKIIVPCTRGNHSRHTKKMVAGLDHRLNYEAMLYKILEQDFSSDLFEWYAPESEITEFKVYDTPMRAFHGERIRSAGGIGGMTISLNKFVMRMDQIKPASYNFMGHYHNYSFPNSRTTANGSVCGMDAYAYGLGCDYQPPIQAFQLFDKNRGMTIKAPIFC
jgi:predicted MPP superfamily phosphohydrolase